MAQRIHSPAKVSAVSALVVLWTGVVVESGNNFIRQSIILLANQTSRSEKKRSEL